MFMKPVYAHEVGQGIVVLQTENGDYFKILKECGMKTSDFYGSFSCTRPESAQPNTLLSNDHVRLNEEVLGGPYSCEDAASRIALIDNESNRSGFSSVELSGYRP